MLDNVPTARPNDLTPTAPTHKRPFQETTVGAPGPTPQINHARALIGFLPMAVLAEDKRASIGGKVLARGLFISTYEQIRRASPGAPWRGLTNWYSACRGRARRSLIASTQCGVARIWYS